MQHGLGEAKLRERANARIDYRDSLRHCACRRRVPERAGYRRVVAPEQQIARIQHRHARLSGARSAIRRWNWNGASPETTTALNQVSETLLGSYRAITENSENITQSSTGYVEQMENLNRNIGGLNTIYEIQLKSISSQLDSIDRVNRGLKDIRDMYEKSAAESAHYCDETEKMARYMKQLNSVYEKMIKAMTVNMYRPMGGMPGVDLNDNDNSNE